MRFLAASILLAIGIVACTSAKRCDAVNKATPLVLDLPSWALADTALNLDFPYDNPLTVEGALLGRKHFYEKALSADGSLSCSSCHVQQFAFSDPRVRSTGMGGAIGQRNAPAIQNVTWDHFFFWDARDVGAGVQS